MFHNLCTLKVLSNLLKSPKDFIIELINQNTYIFQKEVVTLSRKPEPRKISVSIYFGFYSIYLEFKVTFHHHWVNDYRQLNANTVVDSHPLPHIDDILNDCAKGSFFSTINMPCEASWAISVTFILTILLFGQLI